MNIVNLFMHFIFDIVALNVICKFNLVSATSLTVCLDYIAIKFNLIKPLIGLVYSWECSRFSQLQFDYKQQKDNKN